MKAPALLESNSRILIIDDNRAIHDDLRKVLIGEAEPSASLLEDEALLFGKVPLSHAAFEIDSAYQGEEGLEMVARALAAGRPYALAFVDVRMPPGWDGVETIARLNAVDPHLQKVICTAYSDYSWKDIQQRLGYSDSLLVLKKPFDNIEVIQLVHALTRKWLLTHQAAAKMSELDMMVAQRTSELQSATARIQSELRERAKAEEAFRVIFQASPIGIILMGMDGRCLDANAAFEVQRGLRKQDIIGKNVEMAGLLDHETVRALATAGGLDGTEVIFEEPTRGRRVTLLWVRTVEIGGAPHSLGFFLDITERKLMEDELREARFAAEAAARVKGEFLANMSHEIRTPLNGVIGFTKLALSTPLSDEQQDYLETVEHAAGSLMQIINDILDFSKIEAGHLELDYKTFSLRECVDKAVKTLHATAQQKGLSLEWHVTPESPDSVVGDPVRVRQVLLNLIGNAVKFTDKGSVRVEVEVKATKDGGLLAEFHVTDTGIGIAPEQRQFIFEPFRQVNGSLARRHGGTGLGLAISTNLVRTMGGKIWIESQERQGSTFHFTILFESSARPRSACRADSDPDGTLSILVGEDDPAGQTLISALLKPYGHRVTVASSGQQVVSALERETYDLVLMEIQMPGMDGVEATAEIRKRERETGGHIPIIGLTAHALNGDQQRCLESGMDGCVTKPIRAGDLHAAIARHMPLAAD